MGFFEHRDDDQLREAEAPAPSKGSGQKIRVATIERDNGLVTATNQSISSALYDLADQNSLTHTVVLPHGTTVKLAATNSPTMTGAWRSRFSIENGKLGRTVEAKGSSSASNLANQIDLLALAKIDKDALSKVTEAHAAGDAEGVLVALGLREAPLAEKEIHVSGYVTKKGKHVGAYSQIRKAVASLSRGTTLKLPDGISVRRKYDHYEIRGGKYDGKAVTPREAAKFAADLSAAKTHPKAIGGDISHKGFDSYKEWAKADAEVGDNPTPETVAKRAAAARRSVKLPSRKERAENERKAGERRTAERMKKNGGDELDNLDLGGPKAKSTKRSRDGAKRLAADNEAMAKRDAREREQKARRRANDESPMPGIIRKPSEVDAIRAKQGRKSQDKASKSAAANIDREKRKRVKAVAKHPAAKARRRFKGLSEAEAPGLIGR